jgi:hypothetical protein
MTLTISIDSWIWMLGAVSTLCAIGLISYILAIREVNIKINFVMQFRKNFLDWVDSQGNDRTSYQWLLLNSNKMQSIMGPEGIMAVFRNVAYQIKNYPIILNGIPMIDQYFRDYILSRSVDDLIHLIDQPQIRFLGTLKEHHEIYASRIKNPFSCLHRGLVITTSSPLYVLFAFGLMTKIAISNIQHTTIFKAIVFVISVVGLGASLIGITVDGSEALSIWRSKVGL